MMNKKKNINNSKINTANNREYGQEVTAVLDDTDLYIKHLEMLQHAIDRMSQNSFSLKGWAMALVVAICALSSAGSEHRFAIIAFFPVIAFWFLDSYYLQIERKYRALYNHVRCKEKKADLSLEIANIKGKNTWYCKCLFSKTEVVFYGAIIIGVAVLFAWIGVFNGGNI